LNRIKDFLYNKNDILVALAIILLAGLLIYSRMTVIMDYPAVLAAELEEQQKEAGGSGNQQQTQGGQNEEQGTGEGSGEGQGSGEGSGEGQGSGEGSGEGQGTGEGSGEGQGSGEGSGGTSDGPADGTSVKFTVKGGSSWKSVSEDLEDAGLVDSADEFYKVALKLDGKGDLKTLYPGDYFIVAGSTAEEIISTLTTR